MPDTFRVREYDPKKHDKLIGNRDGWIITLKVDGVQVVYREGVAYSRAGNKLLNLPVMPDGIYECFMGDWNTTSGAVKRHDGDPIPVECLYMLTPKLDVRLKKLPDHLHGAWCFGWGNSTTSDEIQACFDIAKRHGYEGLVLHGPDGLMLKVKDKKTYDVPVTGFQGGTGKHLGRMGALLTPMGKVGTGFKDADRSWWQSEYEAGTHLARLIEVECMELTEAGKFRHPRFVRLREDKA